MEALNSQELYDILEKTISLISSINPKLESLEDDQLVEILTTGKNLDPQILQYWYNFQKALNSTQE
jgi:uncharacterized protein YccT (UPF0319 family)